MLRIQACIVGQVGDRYTVEATAEGIADPFVFQIKAKSDNEAAMEAIRRVEAFDGLISDKTRNH